MNKIIFTEEFCQPENLHPFTLTRQMQDIRVGILTIREKWELILGLQSFDKKENDYKDLDRSVNPDEVIDPEGYCLMIHGNVLPTKELVRLVKKLRDGEFVSVNGSSGIVFRFSRKQISEKHKVKIDRALHIAEEIKAICFPWDIFQLNDLAIRDDFELITRKRKSRPISKTNRVTKPNRVFLEKGVKMEHCIINAETGPVYIGKNAQVMEGSVIRGPFAMGEGSCLKAGSKVYGATTLGPNCIAGGEIKNSVMFGNSNKAHDGYLGDSVIGEWCNLGAGTTNSNLKNTASTVKLWTPKGEIEAGLKCGVMMGDYSKTSVNTSINTGTVIGVCAHVFGSGLTPKYIPSFSWGSEGVKRYEFDKAMSGVENWKKLKGQLVTENETKILKHIFDNF
jgi:UDP-N-acetylglucosamine diphosphorylase/glucosamine-1-phosphate N-acetyltransferase